MRRYAGLRIQSESWLRLGIPAALVRLALPITVMAGNGSPQLRLTTVRDILDLSVDESKEARPVCIRGVVTGYDLKSNTRPKNAHLHGT